MTVIRVDLDVKDDERKVMTVYERTEDGHTKTVIQPEEGDLPSVTLADYLSPAP